VHGKVFESQTAVDESYIDCIAVYRQDRLLMQMVALAVINEWRLSRLTSMHRIYRLEARS